ncbi:hypothetical protein [Streptococcus suis]|uniref:hypothetical protein n=1 Tax=Streptococcus suis TaxID=1307 RepID=UPI000408A64C|nr:hypothetical protein [Streptococcus suis]MBS8078823.1 hypothetical protein [Streptococcus suis]MCK3965276.1 hypothetical protein [Streptococcus suis]HEL1708516.1 hypothetical protein [Streptococcus suis]HEL1776827.1 hypothetical protein [Streptococcus suis]HEL1838121.1 hypothetical protein [Streptococcus suis]
MSVVSQSLQLYLMNLELKYQKMIENRWVWFVFALVLLAAIGLYAWYCTSRGRSFAFNVKFNWPRSGQMGIACN